ncbi:MAG: SMC family ATPase [Spirochaetaceae bacterium]|nr:SMC family ATPase [Spirochaetaceae bacterium]
MRLHQLTVSAFGPFAGSEHVDFDVLSTAGIFLFSGATGAGKTSLLDAVCFGLYGEVPGARAGAGAKSSLRSDHAAAGVRPEVTLELTLRGRRLRITRSPQWDRPKLRGSGTTTEPARVLVEESGPEGARTLSTRLDESGHLLGALLGLSLAQFCQVVLLPQGQFADFLRADADKRRALLESLFDTSRFAAVEGWLVGRRQATWRAVEDSDQQIGRLLARVAEASGSDLPDGRCPDDASGWVDQLLIAATAERDEAVRLARRATRAATSAVSAVTTAERVVVLQQRHTVLQARLRTLQDAQPLREAAAAELEAARQVAPLVPLKAEADRLQVELDDVCALAASSSAALGLHEVLLAPVLAATGTDTASSRPFPPAALVGDVSRSTRDEAGRLRHLICQEVELDNLTERIQDLQQEAIVLVARSEEAGAWLAGADSRREVLAASRDAARAAELGTTHALAASDRAEARLAAATRRDALSVTVASARDLVRTLTDAHQVARDELQRIREKRLAGMAAELATGLQAGHDCPVCGSTEHPKPASSADVVSSADEESAAGRATNAEGERHEGERHLGALEVQLAEQRTAAGGELPLESLRAEKDTLLRAARCTAEVASALPDAELALGAFDQEREGWLRRRVSHDEEIRGIGGQVEEQQQLAAGLLADLSAARGEDPTVASRAQRLIGLADVLDGLGAHLGGVERLERDLAAALERVEAAVAERGFGSVEDVLPAVRDDEQQAALDDLRQRHDTDLATVLDQLEDADLVAAEASSPPDLETTACSAQEAERVRDESVAHAAAASARATALIRLATAVATALAERSPLAAAHRVVDGLSRLAEGKSADNRLRMSLSAYVLAARLEQVALSASERLLRMSSGRYSLLHTAEGSTGRARGGLELRVLDAWTGQERDPATLSGGESFSASLALALGLVDVVTAEAGGALLETLFVDEGFGSLDDDTLDDVMGVLDDLRDGGRTVGIVSHVADLRQRIPTQLRVEKGRNGSSVHQERSAERSPAAGAAPSG